MSTSKELTFEIWRTSEKRCYYLMSAAGAGIGYSLATIDPTQTLIESRILLAALACWAASFFFGLSVLSGLQSAIGLSKSIVTIGPEVGTQPHEIRQAFSNFVDQETNSLGKQQGRFIFAQLSLLLAGAFLLVWSKIDVLEVIRGTST